MNPKVTIIMATYNRAHFIVETLQSIQKQSFLDWECLIIDDGATDNTIEVIAPFLERDNHFQYFKRTEKYQKGLPGCRNYGLDLAIGDCVIFFDDDDIVHPENLKVALNVLESETFDFCHYQKKAFSHEKPVPKKAVVTCKKILTIDSIEDVIVQKIGLASCTVLWKKKCFETIRFNEKLLYAEEWECYLRLISENFTGIIIDTILYYNRKHLQSNTGEYFRHNPIRRASNAEAILLVVNNLKDKQLLSASILRYLLGMAMGFKEYNLFQKIIKSLNLSKSNKLKWNIFYISFPLRHFIFRMKKRMKSNI
jgi:glycosyltransferase involved in cell wall biosynthesis